MTSDNILDFGLSKSRKQKIADALNVDLRELEKLAAAMNGADEATQPRWLE
jgi:hypothetical protein